MIFRLGFTDNLKEEREPSGPNLLRKDTALRCMGDHSLRNIRDLEVEPVDPFHA